MKRGWRIILDHLKSKDYWYIRYLVCFLVIGIILVIVVHVLKEYNIQFAVKIFEFFDEWSLVLSASATLLLALIAFWAIIDNRWSLKLNKRESLLNEIVEWATNVTNCSIGVNSSYLLKAEEGGRVEQLLTYAQLTEWGVRLQKLLTIGEYASSAAGVFSDDLKESVKELNKDLLKFVESIKLQADTKYKGLSSDIFRKQVDESVKHRDVMDISAKKVIEVAIKIKTQNII